MALTAGFAGVTFVRLVGMVVLGPSGPDGSRSGDYGRAGRVAIGVLTVCPLALAALTPLEIRVIVAGLSPVVPGTVTTGALKSPWVLQPVFAGFSILSPSWLWVELPVMLALVVLVTLGVSGRRMLRVRRVPAPAVRPPGRLPAVHADRPCRRHRGGDRPGMITVLARQRRGSG